MNTKIKNLLTIAVMAFVAVNFTGCDDDDETLQEKAERLKGSCSYSINHVSITDNRLIEINSTETHIDTRNITDKNYEVSYDLYLGTSVDSMELIDPQNVYINTNYFNMYYVKIIEYVSSNSERYDMDTIGVFKLLCMPSDLYYETYSVGGGDNEFSNRLQIKLCRYDNNGHFLSYLDANFSCELTLTPLFFYSNYFHGKYSDDNLKPISCIVTEPDHSVLVKGGRYPLVDIPAYSIDENGYMAILEYSCEASNFNFFMGNDTIVKQVKSAKDHTHLANGIRAFIMADTANYVYDYGYALYKKIHVGNKILVNCNLYDISANLRDSYKTVTNDVMLDIEQSYGIEKGSLSNYYIIDDLSTFSGFTNKREELESEGYVLGMNTDIVADVYSMLANNWEEENNNAIRINFGVVEFNGEEYTAYRVVWRGMPGVVRALAKGSNGYSNFSVQK